MSTGRSPQSRRDARNSDFAGTPRKPMPAYSGLDADRPELSVNVGRQGPAIVCVVLGFLAMLVDGFDNFAMAYAAPYAMSDLGIANRALLGPVFSAALAGAAVGSLIAGYAADLVGRRPVVVVCCILLGLPSLCISFASSIWVLLLLRAVVGLGVGGLTPVFVSLASELAAPRHRATLVTVMLAGINVGAIGAGMAATWWVPLLGWRMLFTSGGIAGFAIGIVCLFALPESASFLSATAARGATGIARSRIGERPTMRPWSVVRRLFHGELAVITPLVWIVNIGILIAYYAISNWLPALMAAGRRSAADAASFGIIFLIGGTLGAIALSWLIDRAGIWIMALAIAAAIPFVALIGFAQASSSLVYLSVFCAGFGIMSVQISLKVLCAIVYPVEIRASAIGIFFVVGRLAGVLGPLLVSLGLAMGLAAARTLTVVCAPLAISLIACLFLIRTWGAVGRS